MTTLATVHRSFLENAGRRYQRAVADIQRHALMAIAHTVREEWPTASHVVVTGSDQGDWLYVAAIIDPECGEDDNEIELDGERPVENDLDAYASDMFDNEAWGHQWEAFAVGDTGRAGHHAIDLDLVLFCDGDWRKVTDQ